MTTEATNTTPAGGSPLDGGVRPRAWILEPKTQRHTGRWFHYGTTAKAPTDEELEWAEVDGTKYTPLYGQAAIDAAVAAERERCAKVCEAMDNDYLRTSPCRKALERAAKAIRRA